MSPEDHRDQLVDMLLREVVGGESPPDVRERVMRAARLPAQAAASGPVHRRRLPKPATRSKSPMLAVAALLVVCGLAAAYFLVENVKASRSPRLVHLTGEVDRSPGLLEPGQGVETGAQSQAMLTFPDGTTVELQEKTRVRMAERSWLDRSKRLDLVEGRLVAEVAPQAADHPMVLTAGEAVVEVLGTQLSLEHGDEATRLEVVEGVVRFIPAGGGEDLLVHEGSFAEADAGGVRSGEVVPMRRQGLVGFTLMNADTDQPLRDAFLMDGEALSLSSLSTRSLNLRVDYAGEPPVAVRVSVNRADGLPTGIRDSAAGRQIHPPFFAAGDYWAEGRPEDCREWVPQPGEYQISAQAFDANDSVDPSHPPLNLRLILEE